LKIEQFHWSSDEGWSGVLGQALGRTAGLVLVFGERSVLERAGFANEIVESYPASRVVGCSTAGEIVGTRVIEGSVVLTAVEFESTEIRGAWTDIATHESSFLAGQDVGQRLDPDGLVHVFVLSEGLAVNGSDLVRGLTSVLPDSVSVTGGLSGDGTRFERTVLLSGSDVREGAVEILGFYGSRLRVGYGSLGGWDPFGPERLVTRSDGNELYELDGKSALDLYKKYLGEQAEALPSSALMYPLSIRFEGESKSRVRTILGVDETRHSMTFAGDVPVGSYARFMKANFDRLIDGAVGAATTTSDAMGAVRPALSILISCVGRRLVLGQRIEEEVEGVREVLGADVPLTGFYSYGEISPFTNQTMTITTLAEV